MGQAGALIASGVFRRRAVALQELENARAEGAPVPPGVRQAWRQFGFTGRVPASLPRLRKVPETLRLTDPASPRGYRLIRPRVGELAVVDTASGPVQLTPDKILASYKVERARLPLYRRQLADNARALRRSGEKIEAIKAAWRGTFPPQGGRAQLRKLEAAYREKLETQDELSQAMHEAMGRLAAEESGPADGEGVGFVFLAWPLAVVIASLAVGGYGVTHELQSTKRLETQIEAVKAGTLPKTAVGGGSGSLFGDFAEALGGIKTLLLLGGGAWLLLQMRGATRAARG